MKKIALLFIFLFSAVIQSQNQGEVAITWSPNNIYTEGLVNYPMPVIAMPGFQCDLTKRSISFLFKVQVPTPVNTSDLQVYDIITVPISENELGLLDRLKIPANVVPELISYNSREKTLAQITINPLLKTPSGYQKLVSFRYQINIANKSVQQTNAVPSITNSVLASGLFKRFYVEKSGVYKLTKSFLNSLGLPVNSADPRKIKIYGNGGRMVPLSNQADYPFDLTENAVQIIGEDDGTFNDSDYILVYCEGVDNWSEENETHTNLYANRSFYYVTVGNDLGKRIQGFSQPTASPNQIYTSFDDYQYHEVDLTNIGKLGRIWFGENFSTYT